MIEARDLKKYYGEAPNITRALDGVSFVITEGEFVAIVGPSGSGKSTLMHIMGFLDRPSAGTYKLEGQSISDLSDDELARIRNKKLGFIFQTFNLLPRTSVFNNVRLPLQYAGIKGRLEKEKTLEAIAKVNLAHRANHLPNQLSGGEQQRVAIARALVNNPQIIFADEPTGNLDSKSGQEIMDVLQTLNNQGHTIILVTHETYTAEHAKRILHLHDGKLVKDEKVSRQRIARNGEFIK